MPQILTSQNERESQECCKWCQVSARHTVSQQSHCLPTTPLCFCCMQAPVAPLVCMCMYLLVCVIVCTHPYTYPCPFVLLRMWMSPLYIQMCIPVLFVCPSVWHMILEACASSSGGVCAAMENRVTAHVTLFSSHWGRSKAKTPRDEGDTRLGFLTGGCLGHDKSIHTSSKENKRERETE